MNTDKITADEMIIIDRLKQMKMSGMAEAYERLLKKCIVNNRTYFADYMMYQLFRPLNQ